VLFFSGAAWAEDITAQKPGLMCVSAAALARLTLPGGDSRTHRFGASGAESTIARQGGCVNIVLGSKATVLQQRLNTSIVSYPAGAANSSIYVVPNIDFSEAPSEGSAGPGPTDAKEMPSPDAVFANPRIDDVTLGACPGNQLRCRWAAAILGEA